MQNNKQVLIIDNATTCAMRIKTLVNIHGASAKLVHWTDWDYFEQHEANLSPCLVIIEESIPQYLVEKIVHVLPLTPLFLLMNNRVKQKKWSLNKPISPLSSSLSNFELMAILEPYWSEEKNINLSSVLILDETNEISIAIQQTLSGAGITCLIMNRLNTPAIANLDMLMVNVTELTKRKKQIEKVRKENPSVGVICFGEKNVLTSLQFVQYAMRVHLDLALTYQQLNKKWLNQFYQVWREKAEYKDKQLVAKQVETSLDRLLEKSLVMHVLFANSMDGVVCFDASGNILKYNNGYSELLGVTFDAVQQGSVYDWLTPQSKTYLKQAVNNEHLVQQQVLDLQVRHEHNVMIPVSAALNKINFHGNFVFVAVMRNNTNQHLQTKILVQKNAQLDHRSKQLAIHSEVTEKQMLLNDRKQSAFMLSMMETLLDKRLSESQLTAKLKNLKQYFQLQLGQQDQIAQNLCLKTMLEQIVENSQSSLDFSQIKVIADVNPEIKVRFNAEHLDQLFTELFNNSIGNSVKGSAIEIQVGSKSEDKVEILYTNTGMGILDHNQKMMFDLAEANINCTGKLHTGLPLVKALIEFNHGHIQVNNWFQQNQVTGVQFVLTMPLA